MVENLWPNFQLGEPIITPATIMKEQARIFDEQMKGKLQCVVSTDPYYLDNSKLNTSMSILVLELGGYVMRLLTVQYPFANSFPCTIINEVTSSKEEQITNVDDFKAILTHELAKPEVVKVIQTLYAQVMAI